MDDWSALQDVSNLYLLVRKSPAALGEVEAYSEDGGRSPLMKPTEREVRASMDRRKQLGVYKESDAVISGNYYLKMCGNAGLENPEHWIHRTKKFLLNVPAATTGAAAAWYVPFQVAPQGVARNYRVTILNDVGEVQVPERNNFPDGVSVSVPNATNSGFVLVQPEQINYRAESPSPLYQDVPVSKFRPIETLGVPGKALRWPGLGKEMAVWLFGLLKHPTETGLYLGFLHAEL